MARQASEIRTAVPYRHLEWFEDALDGIVLEIVTGEHVVRGDGAVSQHSLRVEKFLDSNYRVVLDRDLIAHRVERGMTDALLESGSVSLICYATAPTLKQSRLLFPSAGDGRVDLRSLQGAADIPDEIPIDVDTDDRLFRDVSGGFDVTVGLVLNRTVVPADELSPKLKGTWLARRSERIRITRESVGSYEIHALTEDVRHRFGLRGRPLFYVRQIDEAVSPLATREIHEVIDIYVDEDLLPRLQSQRPGAATRYIASQIAAQVFTLILRLGAEEFEDSHREEAIAKSVYERARGVLRIKGREPDDQEIASWVTSDPGRLLAEVQSGLDHVEAAEALLS